MNHIHTLRYNAFVFSNHRRPKINLDLTRSFILTIRSIANPSIASSKWPKYNPSKACPKIQLKRPSKAGSGSHLETISHALMTRLDSGTAFKSSATSCPTGFDGHLRRSSLAYSAIKQSTRHWNKRNQTEWQCIDSSHRYIIYVTQTLLKILLPLHLNDVSCNFYSSVVYEN